MVVEIEEGLKKHKANYISHRMRKKEWNWHEYDEIWGFEEVPRDCSDYRIYADALEDRRERGVPTMLDERSAGFSCKDGKKERGQAGKGTDLAGRCTYAIRHYARSCYGTRYAQRARTYFHGEKMRAAGARYLQSHEMLFPQLRGLERFQGTGEAHQPRATTWRKTG
eukprot:6961922-Heterocapsa_arctica.AAC.1